jgi:chromate transporter
MTDRPLLQLALILLPLSLISVGGGQAVLADIQRQVVGIHGWVSTGDFVDLFAVSRLAPGPGSLIVSLIGWKVAGWNGALVATLAFVAPSSLLFYGLTRWRNAHAAHRWVRAVEAGLAPISAGLVMASGFVLLSSAQGGPLAWVVAFASTAALMSGRVGPYLLLGAGALVFIVFG